MNVTVAQCQQRSRGDQYIASVDWDLRRGRRSYDCSITNLIAWYQHYEGLATELRDEINNSKELRAVILIHTVHTIIHPMCAPPHMQVISAQHSRSWVAVLRGIADRNLTIRPNFDVIISINLHWSKIWDICMIWDLWLYLDLNVNLARRRSRLESFTNSIQASTTSTATYRYCYRS